MTLKILSDYKDPFDAILDFEKMLSDYTGAPYVVLTDCCTHAIELCFRHRLSIQEIKSVTIPSRTYLSVPMLFHKLDIPYDILDGEWYGEYNFGFTNIWDSARKLSNGMYRNGQIQCLSFGRTKPLEIGRGGAILLGDAETYKWLKMASYDGRDLSCVPWESQETFNIGYHYMMRIEECIDGMNKMISNNISHSYTHKYPNINNITINK